MRSSLAAVVVAAVVALAGLGASEARSDSTPVRAAAAGAKAPAVERSGRGWGHAVRHLWERVR
jgi:hypothetical protein